MKNKILIIDKDEKAQNILVDLLSADYDCILLHNSSEGISQLEIASDPIELMIIDIDEAMRNDNKLLICAQENYLYRNIPIMIGATPDQTDSVTQVLALGADDILYKPINTALARKRIYNLLAISLSRRTHNVMEELIQTEIDNNIDVLGICPCPKCRTDLLTITLNNVKPKYVNTEKGKAITKAGRLASMDSRISLLAEITRYAKLVADNPHHA